MPGEGAHAEGSNVEIFIETVAGNVTLSNAANATEVLVKVVELYFCERCSQSFPEASLLSQHQCLLLAPPGHLELPGPLLASASEGQSKPGGSELPRASTQEGSAAECLLCPICREAFTQPGELKEHFKTHRTPPGALSCPEKGCCFTTEDRKQLRGHLRRLHGASPVSCAYRACPLLFPSRPAMEQHHRTHFPFHCGHCDFVTANAKLFWQHKKSHAAEPPAEVAVTGSPPGSATHGLKQQCSILPSAAEEGQEEAGNCHSGWEATRAEARPAKPTGTGEGSLEGQKTSAGEEDSDSGGDESPEEDGESPCEDEAKENGKAAPEKARVPRAQHFKGDVAEGSEYLYKTHMCPECKRCFKKRTHLVEHLHLHFPDPSLQCPNCHKYFTSKSKLKIHMMRETGEKAHRCPLCHYSSVEKNALNRHMASMHEDISNFYSDVYSCPVCGEKFRLSQALKEHLKTHKAEPKRLSCFQSGCDYCAEDRKEFVRHLKDAHSIKAVECKYHACSLLFGTAEAMEAHRKTHYAFHCQQCDFICSNKHVFRKHKKQGHPGSEQLQCSFCPYATFNPVEFHDHVGKMHANEKIHKCTECTFATAHKRVLIRHMLLHTGEKPHKCELCDFTCRDVSYLSKHMLTHSNDKNFMCTECGYITKWKHYLNVHMRKHTGDLRYQCNQCSYRCHRADQLSSHKLRHQGKSLICEVCGFACKRKYELQKHMQAKHSQNYQVPVFQCQYCTYQTKYKQALLNHENCKHTKQKEFRCALCSYCTFSNTSLFFHKRKIHGYVPGDKDWLENYASKELEISSSEALFGYELGTALRVDASSPLASKEQWAKSGGEAKGGVGEGEQSHPTAGDALGEALNVSSDPLLEHLNGESCTTQPESVEMLSCKEPPAAYEMLGSQDDLGLEDNDNTLEDIPDFEEEEADVQQDEASHPPVPEDTATSGDDARGGSESVLKALRKQDKEQAETLVLEGRVQMLVVQSESQIFKFLLKKNKILKPAGQEPPGLCQPADQPGDNGGASCPPQLGKPLEKYRLEGGKLHCNACSFVCSRVSTITSHVEDGALKSHCAEKHIMHPEEDEPQSTELPEVDPASIETGQPMAKALRLHRKLHRKHYSKRPQLQCRQCEFTCKQARCLRQHVRIKHEGVKPHKCRYCEFSTTRRQTFGTNSKLRIHRLRNDITRHHVLRRHEEKKQHPHLECSTCKETFATREALEEHKTQHFSHRCELCSFAAKERQQLLVFDQHMKGHGGTRVYKCSDCEYTTKNRQKITWHIRIHTGEKPYKCHLCKYACADPSRLKYHMRIHKEERKYLCPDCGYKCKWVNQLKYHMTKHTGLKPYRCDECEYRTNRADALRVHKETRHREARSFICEQCGKAFKTRFLLKTHLKKHSEEKPYVCNACGRAFRWAAGLRHHYLTHTNEHPFFCRYCPYKAKQKFQVIKHIQRHHPEHGASDPSQGRESQAKGPPGTEQEGGHPVEKDNASQ
ncbi:hypothetical protein llap_3115 [Limosa lapponica baueri]|uniref:Zinc finger protein 142 n=1 Tax=Limosa lapponica baueri TaxID=1758121 RepID=A0A2I0UKM3_LIMLA|nr:hypothetical protein llap_3115 [Limosa lapponica baueri]